MKFGKFGKLPGRPSTLIARAVRDVENAVNKRHFILDMTRWFKRSTPGQKCQVCFAGAVMVNSLGAKAVKGEFDLMPENFGAESPALLALNNFRRGAIHSALGNLCIPEKDRWKVKPYMEVYGYRRGMQGFDDKKKFLQSMKDLAKYLKQHGL